MSKPKGRNHKGAVPPPPPTPEGIEAAVASSGSGLVAPLYNSVTVLYVDGNSIAAMAVERCGEEYCVLGLEHLEVDQLLEVVKRLRHPIFMDLNFCLMPEKERIQQYFERFLDRKIFQHPTVCLLAPEKVWTYQAEGEATLVARDARRSHLFTSAMPVNPYEYPAIVVMQEQPQASEVSKTTMMRARLADFVQINQVTQTIKDRLIGFCSGTAAASRAVEVLPTDAPGQEIMLCDVGKLRTLYAHRDGTGRVTFNPIPVGLARDDTHYFRSISPETEKLQTLQTSIGNLLFPPEATPSPLFSITASSPQVDCTRLALQISRYALRAFNSSDKARPMGELGPVHFLTGRGSRLPGIREYMVKKTGAEFRRVDRRPLIGIRLADGIRLGDVADNLMMLGAAMEALDTTGTTSSLLNLDFKSPPMKRRRCSFGDMRDNVSYVFEHGTE